MTDNDAINEIRKLFIDPRKGDGVVSPGQIGGSRMLRTGEMDKATRRIPALVSTTDVARDGAVILAEAWREYLPIFRENPVGVAGHVYVGPAGEATVTGYWPELEVTREGLAGVKQFSTTPLANDYYTLYSDGSMRAFSVRWLTHDSEIRQIKVDGQTTNVRHFTVVECLEISDVTIPSDRGALKRALSLYNSMSMRTRMSDLATRTYNRLEELIEPTLEQIAMRADAIERMSSNTIRALSVEEIPEAEMGKLIRGLITGETTRIFNTDPGSLLCGFIQDIVEATVRRLAPKCDHDDVPIPGAVPGRKVEQRAIHQELTGALRSIVGT